MDKAIELVKIDLSYEPRTHPNQPRVLRVGVWELIEARPDGGRSYRETTRTSIDLDQLLDKIDQNEKEDDAGR